MRTPVGPAVPTSLPMYHPGAPGMGQQLYYGQPPPGLIPPQVYTLCPNPYKQRSPFT